MAEDMRGKTDELSSNDWSSDYSGFSLLNVPIKKAVRLGWVMDDEIMELWNLVYLPMVVWAVSQLNHKKRHNAILDVGVGNGASSKYLKKHFPNSQVLGIDISSTAIRAAEKLAEPGLSFEVKNVEKTNLPF